MSHRDRCRFAKTEKKKCKCSCRGTLHGKEKENSPLGAGEILLTRDIGGEIEQFLKENQGKEYYCFGTHKAKRIASGMEEFLHKATEFWGIKTTGSGLRDKSGDIYEVFALCPNAKFGPYQTSYRHFPHMVEKAKIEREYILDFGDDL